jgi:hypothetical protein
LTLNEVVKREGQVPELVRIGGNACKLRALKGASTLFGLTEVFIVECALCGHRSGTSLGALCSFMESQGYRSIDIFDSGRCPERGFLWGTQIAFLRQASAAWARLDDYESAEAS